MMDSPRKIIELSFEENGVSPETPTRSPSDNVKLLNFDGMIIEIITENHAKNEKKSLKTKQKTSDPIINGSKTNDNKPNGFTATIPTPHLPSAPTITEELPAKDSSSIAIENIMDNMHIEGHAAGLWAQDEASADCFQEPAIDPLSVPCYETLLESYKSDLIFSREEFVCSLCEEFMTKGNGVTLKGCAHSFCEPCLVLKIHETHDMLGDVRCPHPIVSCEGRLKDEEIKTLLGDGFELFCFNLNQMMDEELRAEERQAEADKYDGLPALLDADNHHYIENFEAFECSICLTDCEVGDGVILKNCLHKFCKICIIESVKHSDDAEVKCPHTDTTGSCTFTIQEREIRSLVPEDIFSNHLEKSLKTFEGASENAYHCKTPDCRGFAVIEANITDFFCPVCNKKNCIKCKVIHEGKTCQEYEDERNPEAKNQRENAASETAIQNLIAGDQAMLCPKCSIPVMKIEGCDFITCTSCKLGICWRTRRPRLPIQKQNGEIIDGCHCREGGKLCHPNCGNCH